MIAKLSGTDSIYVNGPLDKVCDNSTPTCDIVDKVLNRIQ